MIDNSQWNITNKKERKSVPTTIKKKNIFKHSITT